jgi:alpha-methylacyl-CoA racemase
VPGPLDGVRVVELAGLGAAPFACMVLADLGADVVRVDRPAARSASDDTPPRPAAGIPVEADLLARSRRSVAIDLKQPAGRALVLQLATGADALVEAFRPGVAERLGVGPDDCRAVNPRLVYGRLTGWGQEGPLAPFAGHDVDYVALTGALWATGRADGVPLPPLNLLGDFAGGGMLLAVGVLAALLEARTSGRGQVVDAAMVDGVALLTTMVAGLRAAGRWHDEREANLLDGGAPFYQVYECADGRYLAVGALEPAFYDELVARSGFSPDARSDRDDPATWPEQKRRWAELFRTRPRDEWAALLEHSDACVAPVLDWAEAQRHPHLAARRTYVDVAGVRQPAPAPRFERTPTTTPRPPDRPGAHTLEVLAELGLPSSELDSLLRTGVISAADRD